MWINKNHYWLYAIIVLAVVLRLLGIWHGYPFSYYPDEAHFVKRSLSFGSGDFNPHWFHKPAFFMYLLFVEYGIMFVVGKVLMIWNSVEDFAVSFISNPGPFYIVGRLTVAAFSVGSILVTYRIGERHFSRETGLFAALLLALSFGHVATSQDIKADIPAMFFTVLSMYFLLNYLDKKQIKSLLAAAAMAGIGTAVKYYPIVMLGPIFLGVILIHGYPVSGISSTWKKIILLCLSSLAIFFVFYFISSPYNFLDPVGRNSTFGPALKFLHILGEITGITETTPVTNAVNDSFIVEKMDRLSAIRSYMEVLLATRGMGMVIGLMGFAGVISMLFSKRMACYVFLSFPFIFIFVSTVLFPGLAQTRHQIPVYPFFALAGGYFIVWLSQRLQARVVYSVTLVLLVVPLYFIVQNGLFLSRVDTRNLAKQWIESNIPAETRIVLDEMGPVLFKDEKQLTELIQQADDSDPTGQFTAHYSKYLRLQLLAAKDHVTYNISEIRFPWWRDREPENGVYKLTDYDRDAANPLRPIGVKTLGQYQQAGYKYVIVSSTRYKTFLDKNNDRYHNFPSFRRFYLQLFERGRLVMEFSPDTNPRPGPTIRIYDISHL